MQDGCPLIKVESTMSERKRTVLDLLRENPGFVSGEAISNTLGISRNAVHKHVNSLRKRGYRIVGISRRGYRLEQEPSALAMTKVVELTERCALGHFFRHYDEIGSTNVEAKNLAIEGAPEGTVVVAECQTAGRGRLGRQWTSPTGKGLLFSVVLRPSLAMGDAHMLTLVAAVATAEALEQTPGIEALVKWPNDLFIGDKKVGGILMEVAGQQDEVDWVVLGIGINVNTEFVELPVALRRTATSLLMEAGHAVDRSSLLASLLLSIERRYTEALAGGFESVVSNFRQRDYLTSKTVNIETRDGRVSGTATGIDERGALLVELPHHHIKRVHSGDVTLRH